MKNQVRQRPTQLYDVAVLGNAFPGLVAAALLAQRGLRVLHVAAGAATYEAGSFRLPAQPELLPAPKQVAAIREVLEELTLAAPAARVAQEVQAQVVLPHTRLELGESGRFAKEIASLCKAAEEMQAAVVGAPLLPRTAGERLRRWRHGASHRALFAAPLELGNLGSIGEALLALHRFASGDEAAPGALAFARSTIPLLGGFHRLPEGGLAGQLVGHVRARRGDALVARVDEILLDGGRFSGLQIGGERWMARSLLAALPAAEVAALLPEGRRRTRFEAFAAPSTPVPLQVRNLVLAREGVPPGLGPLAIAAGFEGAPTLVEVRPTITNDGLEDPGLRTITLTSFGENEAVVEEVLPFHRRHLRHESSSPAPGANVRVEAPRKLGIEGLPIATPIKGLLLAGPELLPGLGLEGAFLAGRAVAAEAEASTGKSKP